MASTTYELDKVRLDSSSDDGNYSESEDGDAESMPDTDTSLESDLTPEELDEEAGIFDFDVIKWAIWRDPGKDVDDFMAGWRYMVIWNEYYKTQSDSEVNYLTFDDTDTGKDPLRRFWTKFSRKEHPYFKLRRGQREPGPPPRPMRGKPIMCPPEFMKKQLHKQAEGWRSYKRYKKRLQWQIKHNFHSRVPKRLSDHYRPGMADHVEKIAKERRERIRERQKELGQEVKDVEEDRPGPEEAESSKGPAEVGGTVAQQPKSKKQKEKKSKSVVSSSASSAAGPSRSTSPSQIDKGKGRAVQVARSGAATTVTSDGLKSLFEDDESTPVPSIARVTAKPGDVSAKTSSTAPLPKPVAAPPPLKKRKGVDDPDKDGKAKAKVQKKERVPEAPAPAPPPPPPPVPFSAAAFARSLAPPKPPAPPPAPQIKSSAPAGLASLGKISKKPEVSSPLPTPAATASAEDPARSPSVVPSFGDYQPGIFEPARPPTPNTAATQSQRSTEPAAAEPSTCSSQSAAPGSSLFLDTEAPDRQPSPIGQKSPLPPPVATAAKPETKPPSPKQPLSSRPKYVQGKKIQTIDEPGLSRLPLRKSSIPSSSSLPSRPSGTSPLNPYTGQSPDAGGQTPLYPSNFGGQSPPGPSGYGSVRPPRASAYVPRDQTASTTRYPPAGPSNVRPPTQPKNFRQPGPPVAVNPLTHLGGPKNLASPPWPQAGVIPAQSIHQQLPPPPPTAPPIATAGYNTAADPRRKPTSATQSPNLPYLASPVSAQGSSTPIHPSSDPMSRVPSADFPEPLTFVASLPLREPPDAAIELRLVPGAARQNTSPTLCQRFLGQTENAKRQKMDVSFEEVTLTAVRGILKLGAQIMQWTKAARVDNRESGGEEAYGLLKKSLKSEKAYAAYPELDANRVEHHYAILVISPHLLDLSELGPARWAAEDVSIAVMVLRLPLNSVHPPKLYHPIRREDENDVTVTVDSTVDSSNLLSSYGITDRFVNDYRQKYLIKYPGKAIKPVDILDRNLDSIFQRNGVLPLAGGKTPDGAIVYNLRLGRSIHLSSTLRSAIVRRTTFYALGPSLNIYPSQWGLRKVWEKGALVTFSPTFILHSPDRFKPIMKLIRATDTWGAYILPSVIEWAQQSWTEPARCPDPTAAYEALSNALSLDDTAARLSDTTASDGLAVSCAPPCIYDTEACLEYNAWRQKLNEQADLDGIAAVCQEAYDKSVKANTVSSENGGGGGATSTQNGSRRQLELVDIEQDQLADLTAMRTKPHLLPYRRYLYVGEMSLSRTERERLGGAIEFVTADDFTATFSGAI